MRNCCKLGTEHFLVTRQYEAGLGAYQSLGKRWLLSALGGFGQAYCRRGYVDLGIFGPDIHNECEASYTKYFGQAGVAHVGPARSIGFTYRLVQVRFNYLNEVAQGPLPLPAMLRHELTYFVRSNLTKRWQLTLTSGVSLSGTAKLDASVGYPTYGWPEYYANRNLLPAFFWSLGVIFQSGRATR